MALEEWTVHAKLSGEFYVSDERKMEKNPLVEGLQQFTISPILNDSDEFMGVHKLDAVMLLENKVDTPLESYMIYERAKNLVESVTVIATLGIGRPVLLVDGFSVKHRFVEEPTRYRVIISAMQSTTIAPPVPLPSNLFDMLIDPKMQRVAHWYAKGLVTSDAINRLMALNNALDLLSGMVDGAPDRVRKCNHCGAEESIQAGLKERVVFFLNHELGFPLTLASDIYESRLDLVHARSNLVEENLHRYRNHADIVAAAVRSGIERALSISLPSIPVSLPFDPQSAFLDLIYEDNDKTQNLPDQNIP